MNALFDTNILIDFLNGLSQARGELARYSEKSISIITWMEVLVGAEPATEALTRAYLDTFVIVPLDAKVANRAVAMRREHRMRLPDAIVLASADVHDLLLVTRNTKDFRDDQPGVRVPYRL